MKILLRSKEKKGWQKIEPSAYDNEAQLEGLLADSPDLLPPVDGEEVIFFQRQVTLGQNAADLLGVTPRGGITLVECKLDSNREARRTVVAQVLEYAAQLWGMDYEEFDGLLAQGCDESLVELVRRRAGKDWSEEMFRAGIERALGNGAFRLVIAVSSVTDELTRILEYVNSRGNLQIEALELRHFCSETDEVLVPEVYGTSNVAQPPGGGGTPPPPRRTLEEVIAAAADLAAGHRLRTMVEGWQAAGHQILPGTSGVSFRTMVQGKSWWIFRALTPNRLTFPRRGWLDRGIPKGAVDEFFSTLATISAAVRDKVVTQSEPNLYVDELSDADATKILEAALRLVRRWNESLAPSEPDAAMAASA